MNNFGGKILILLGAGAGLTAALGFSPLDRFWSAALLFILPAAGALLIFVDRSFSRQADIDNDRMLHSGITARGPAAVALFLLLTGFYIAIYFGSDIRPLAGGRTLHDILQQHFYSLFDPLSQFLRGRPADNWFFYSLTYTYFVLLFGGRMILRYRHDRYQQLRTVSVMLVQLGFGFLIPSLLIWIRQPEFYFSYFWPLKPEYLYPSKWFGAVAPGSGLLIFFLLIAFLMTFIATPLLTYFFGKRWYCSWVCGCGGLAETAGDPFRHLSDKSLRAWKIERISIHSVLLLITFVTLLLWINSLTGGGVLGKLSGDLKKGYGFFIGLIWAGVVGVGFYPLMGNRVWCRFGCPMAAALGILQRSFSRFRITVNGGQCISCGNCSAYCEMGINVRWYAQRGQNVVRASCVGCGICTAVCPRGVLRLENGPRIGRTDLPL